MLIGLKTIVGFLDGADPCLLGFVSGGESASSNDLLIGLKTTVGFLDDAVSDADPCLRGFVSDGGLAFFDLSLALL